MPEPRSTDGQELPDLLGEEFPADRIRERNGVHVVFTAARVGEEVVLRADVQNNVTAPRRVTFVVTPDGAGRFKHSALKEAESEIELAGGEVGRFELTIPIPPEARASEKFWLSLRARGIGGERCRSARRTFLSERVPPILSVLIMLSTHVRGGLAAWREGTSITVETTDRGSARTPAPARARYSTKFRPNPPLVTSGATMTPEQAEKRARTNRIVLGISGAVALALASYGAWYFTHPAVFIVNGFDSTLEITVAGARRTVAPRSVTKTHFAMGRTLVRAERPDGTEVDVEAIDSSFPSRVIVWNIAGAAPVFERELTYFRDPEHDHGSAEPRLTLYCGKRVLHFSGVDFAFETPPRTVELDSRFSDQATQMWLDVLRMDDPRSRCDAQP